MDEKLNDINKSLDGLIFALTLVHKVNEADKLLFKNAIRNIKEVKTAVNDLFGDVVARQSTQ